MEVDGNKADINFHPSRMAKGADDAKKLDEEAKAIQKAFEDATKEREHVSIAMVVYHKDTFTRSANSSASGGSRTAKRSASDAFKDDDDGCLGF